MNTDLDFSTATRLTYENEPDMGGFDLEDANGSRRRGERTKERYAVVKQTSNGNCV